MTRTPRIAVAACLSLLPFVGAMLAGEPAGRAGETIERVAAVVNNEIILVSEVRDRTIQIGGTPDDGTPDSHKRMRQVLDRMIEDALVLQQAQELKLTVEEAEIDRAVDEIKKANNLDGAAFAQALQEQGYSLASFRRDMRKQILRLKTVNQAVRSRLSLTEEDLKAQYEQSVRQSGGRREAHVRHVLVAVPPSADAKTIDAKRRLAARVLEEARGGADFGKLAQKYSDDSLTRDEGGDLGWLKENGGLPETMVEVIFSMDKNGEVRGPVKTDRGFEVFQLVERREGDVRPFEEVKEQIRAQLSQQQIEKQTQLWIQELRKKAHIEVRL